MEKEQTMYEIGYLMTPFVAEEKIDEEVAVLRKIIEDKKGLIVSEGRPKARKLAYEIKSIVPKGKFDAAAFGWIKFVVKPADLASIKDGFTKSDKVIRFLTIKTEKETGTASGNGNRRTKPATALTGAKDEEKVAIKPEEIDKRLEELIGKDEMAEGEKAASAKTLADKTK